MARMSVNSPGVLVVAGTPIGEAAALISEGTDPFFDQAASAEFRRHLAEVLGRRALEEAMAR